MILYLNLEYFFLGAVVVANEASLCPSTSVCMPCSLAREIQERRHIHAPNNPIQLRRHHFPKPGFMLTLHAERRPAMAVLGDVVSADLPVRVVQPWA